MSNIIILLITLITSSSIIFIVIKKKHNPGALSLILFTLAVSIAALANFYIYHVPPSFIPLWFAITSFSLRMGYTTILTFVIQYTQHGDWLKRSNLFALALDGFDDEILRGMRGTILDFSCSKAVMRVRMLSCILL